MGYTAADLDQAERHVSHGEKMVRSQQAVVDEGGLDHEERRAAEAWLGVFRTSLAKHIAERDRIAEALATRFP